MLNSNSKRAFSMIELIFVIVVIGILAGVALPRLVVTRDDAVRVKGKTQIASIRNSVMIAKNLNLLQGNAAFPTSLDDALFDKEGESLFDGDGVNKILEYPVSSKKSSGGWVKTAANEYNFYIDSVNIIKFTYNSTNGHFDCNKTVKYCDELTR